MSLRILTHMNAPRVKTCNLEVGRFLDLAVSDQFLIDSEFISRHYEEGKEITCLYPCMPSYLHNLSDIFPNIHFIVFRSTEVSYPDIEYNPETPDIDGFYIRKENITHSPYPFTKQMAWRLAGKKGLLFICHAETQIRQLAFHILMQPEFSLFDMTSLPQGYIQGDLILPIGLQQGKCLIFLDVARYGKSKVYDNHVFHKEIAHFQTIDHYDHNTRELIIHQLASLLAKEYSQRNMIIVKLRFILTILDLVSMKDFSFTS